MIKKSLKSIIILWIFSTIIWNTCFWIGRWDYSEKDTFKFPYDNKYVQDNPTTELQDQVDYGMDDTSIMTRLLKIFNLDTKAINWSEHKFINYVRAIINIALWLLSFIALIMVIYTFYMMFFSENEEWIKKAKWNLIGIFIALAIIWLAWLIVSFIFWWYQENRKNRENDIQQWHITKTTNKIINNHIYFTI